MKKIFWRANLLAGAAAAVIFCIMAGLLHWSIAGSFMVALGLFLGLTVLLTPRTAEEMRMPFTNNPRKTLDEQAVAVQEAALRCRDAEVRDAGRNLYFSVQSVLDYLAAAPEKAAKAAEIPADSLSGAKALLEKYLLGEPESLRTEVLETLKALDSAFEQQLIALLRDEDSGEDQRMNPLDQQRGAFQHQ